MAYLDDLTYNETTDDPPGSGPISLSYGDG